MFEFQVKLFRDHVLAHAARGDVPTDVVVAAMADVVGIAAATLDRHGGTATLADRLSDFEARVRQTYRATKDRIETKTT